jgi:two-component system, NtrC family, response regulator
MNILIVDDNVDFCTTIADIIHSFDYTTHTLHRPEETLSYIDNNYRKISALLLDIEFQPESMLNGIDILDQCRRNWPSIPVIMISGKGSIATAVRATQLGAINFIEKSSLSKEKLKEVIQSAVERSKVSNNEKEIQMFLESQGIIGTSQAIIDVGDKIIRFGRTDLNVLITGETGTGKKLVARAIHAISRRAKYQIVTVDIPNIPRELFQSELFGHNKGSFSGATDTTKGLFNRAHKGTLFLDEIGDLSPELQSNLFIPIEEKSIRKVGSTELEEINVRFVSATDKDLIEAMKESRFREQLYHRLRECEIHIPPLRERREDIPLIVRYYLLGHNKEFEETKRFSSSAIDYLKDQEWSGNVRELASVVRVALQTVKQEQIEVADLYKIVASPLKTNESFYDYTPIGITLKEGLAQDELKKIEMMLEKTNGNVSKAAAMLDISRETLHNKIRKYSINTQNFRNKKSNSKG